jgi:hypothetical protein
MACSRGAVTGVGTAATVAAIAGVIAWAAAAAAGTDVASETTGGAGGTGTVGAPPMTAGAPVSGVAGTVAAELRPALNKDRHNAAPTMAKPTSRARST